MREDGFAAKSGSSQRDFSNSPQVAWEWRDAGSDGLSG